MIAENIIKGGRTEGIFIMEAGECWIVRNRIELNNDGIVCYRAIPIIMHNNIIKNKSIG